MIKKFWNRIKEMSIYEIIVLTIFFIVGFGVGRYVGIMLFL